MGTFMQTGTVLPRRLTRLFADTKQKFDETVVQTRQNGSESSPLNLKMRIQKDRLIAWGFQWSDRSAAEADDIDGSLDRADISDLVASIMSSIKELLDEAESLQPPVEIQIQGVYDDMKQALGKMPAAQWTETNFVRLEEILKDLTTSIDTLCDLSRARVDVSETAPGEPPKSLKGMDGKLFQELQYDAKPTIPRKPVSTVRKPVEPSAEPAGLTNSTYIDLHLQASNPASISSPPSYESVATGSEDRALAYCSPPTLGGESNKPSIIDVIRNPLLVDYGPLRTQESPGMVRPDETRFEELFLALLSHSEQFAQLHTGILKLVGWTVDPKAARCAYVYDIPRTASKGLQPRSLLYFLQNGGDADTNNMPSLENRFQLAMGVASSLMHLHAMGITHRNFNSNNVLFFVGDSQMSTEERIWKGPVIRKPFIAGFHQMSSTGSGPDGDPSFLGIYHHPCLEAWFIRSYGFVHDYYSLGLILLEIGLWMPIGKFWKSKYTRADFKARLEDIYLKKLSSKCGDGYMNAVLYCMRAADDDSYDPYAPSSTYLEHSSQTEFYRHVIKPLERCCMIDTSVFPSPLQPPESAAQAEPTRPSLGVSSPGEIGAMPAPDISPPDARAHRSADEEQLPAHDLKSPSAQATGTKVKVWSHDIPALYSQYWSSTMFPKLEKILSKAINRWESYTVDLFMAGEDADTARPTIYVECASTGKVRKILRHLNKDLRLFEIKVVPGQIVRSKAGKKRRKVKKAKVAGPGPAVHQSATDFQALNPKYQVKPACGASIGAFLNGSHLPPVSFGGIVLVDGEPYGMSVHHMLEDEDESPLDLEVAINLQRSMAPREQTPRRDLPIDPNAFNIRDQTGGLYPFEVSEIAEQDDVSSGSYDFSDYPDSVSQDNTVSDALYPFETPGDDSEFDEAPLDDSDHFWLSAGFEHGDFDPDYEDDEGEINLGDTDGVPVGEGQNLLVTSPAIDDVNDDFFPVEEHKDNDHLCSHMLGHIHASSGIKRSRQGELTHEVDWALLRIHEKRLQANNCIQGGSRFCKSQLHRASGPGEAAPTSFPDSYPCKVMPASALGGLEVHALGRTSGLQMGVILPAMRMVRMPGRAFASHSWQVRGSFGEGGDSGAWVIDNASGHVCGHVLAYSSASSVAYIAPMEVLLSDMARTLRKEITLPEPSSDLVGCHAPPEDVGAPACGGYFDGAEARRGDPASMDMHGKTSPPLPTSPPTLVHEMSTLSLTELNRTQTRGSVESGGPGPSRLAMRAGALEEAANQVQTRC